MLSGTLRGSVQFISVAQSCPTLCDPMNRSTPGLPVHHQLPERLHKVKSFSKTEVTTAEGAGRGENTGSNPKDHRAKPNPQSCCSFFFVFQHFFQVTQIPGFGTLPCTITRFIPSPAASHCGTDREEGSASNTRELRTHWKEMDLKGQGTGRGARPRPWEPAGPGSRRSLGDKRPKSVLTLRPASGPRRLQPGLRNVCIPDCARPRGFSLQPQPSSRRGTRRGGPGTRDAGRSPPASARPGQHRPRSPARFAEGAMPALTAGLASPGLANKTTRGRSPADGRGLPLQGCLCANTRPHMSLFRLQSKLTFYIP